MDIDKKIYRYEGLAYNLKEDKLIKYISSNNYFSGAVEFGKTSTIIFKCVNAKTMMYIMDELIKDGEDLKIEIQTHVSIAEALQRSDYIAAGL